ncbi:DUF4291 family protein [Saccharothrix lopnurensis]|uniref:DUF4291 family protein n=1 Tax=Saccharothrix lopnurensis TaxID=1670621 RepID=A0ABW1PHH3_9PSEU
MGLSYRSPRPGAFSASPDRPRTTSFLARWSTTPLGPPHRGNACCDDHRHDVPGIRRSRRCASSEGGGGHVREKALRGRCSPVGRCVPASSWSGGDRDRRPRRSDRVDLGPGAALPLGSCREPGSGQVARPVHEGGLSGFGRACCRGGSAPTAVAVVAGVDPFKARDLRHRPLGHRSLQIGLRGEAVRRYVEEWITAITDVTDVMRAVGGLVAAGHDEEAAALLPVERPCRLSEALVVRTGSGTR